MKKGIHPEYHQDAKIYCNGELVMTVGSTKPQMTVDVWSGNHPFYTGEQRQVSTAGQVDRFMKRLQASQEQQAAANARKAAKDTPPPKKKSLVEEIFGEES
jgi:large subunit ribosomal protein L31